MYVPNVDELVLISMTNATLTVVSPVTIDPSELHMEPLAIIQVAGFVAKVDDDAIFLAQASAATDNAYMHIVAVPRSQIMGIVRLRRYGTEGAAPPVPLSARSTSLPPRPRRGESATVALVADAAEE